MPKAIWNGAVLENAAQYYADLKEAANDSKGHIAFWRGVTVEV